MASKRRLGGLVTGGTILPGKEQRSRLWKTRVWHGDIERWPTLRISYMVFHCVLDAWDVM